MVDSLYLNCAQIAKSEARKVAFSYDDALSMAGVLLLKIMESYTLASETNLAMLFRISLRNSLINEVKRWRKHEVLVETHIVRGELDRRQSSEADIKDVETKIWWEQMVEGLDLMPAEKAAAVKMGRLALSGRPCTEEIPSWLLYRIRKKMQRALLKERALKESA